MITDEDKNKIDELVEWVAIKIANGEGRTDWEGLREDYSITCIKCKKHYRELAKQILSNPDLALIVPGNNFKGVRELSVIPLAEALKEMAK